MVTVHLSAVVNKDRQLIVTLPDEIPDGPVELIIQIPDTTPLVTSNPARENARAKLAAAGMLSHAHNLPTGVSIPSNEEVAEAGRLSPEARSIDALINEDRDER